MANNRLGITREEWMQALGAFEFDEGGSTVREMCKHTGLHRARIQEMLRELIEKGKARCVRKIITTIAGRQQVVPAYVIIKKKKEENDKNREKIQ